MNAISKSYIRCSSAHCKAQLHGSQLAGQNTNIIILCGYLMDLVIKTVESLNLSKTNLFFFFTLVSPTTN